MKKKHTHQSAIELSESKAEETTSITLKNIPLILFLTKASRLNNILFKIFLLLAASLPIKIYPQSIILNRESPNNAGLISTPCGTQIVFKVRVMQDNTPQSGVTVFWSTEAGSNNTSYSTSDVNGYASITHTVGSSDGQQYRVSAQTQFNPNQLFWQIKSNCTCMHSLVCKNLTLLLNSGGIATISASDLDGGSNLCGGQLAISNGSFTKNNLGINHIKIQLLNSNNQVIDSCVSIVTVIDNIAPTAICKNTTLTLDANGTASIDVSQINNGSYDNCSIASISLIGKTQFSCADLGTNTVLLIVTDGSGNQSSCAANILVVDNIAPITICKNITVALDANGAASVDASQINNGSSDNCSIAYIGLIGKTQFSCTDLGTNEVSLLVTDGSGNQSSCAASVNVVDLMPPIAIAKNISITLVNGTASVSADQINNGSHDNCSIVSMQLIGKTTFGCSDIGFHNVSLQITDNSGNVGTADAIVNVIGEIPVATITSSRSTCYYGYSPYSSAVLSAAGGDYYSWNTGASNSTINISPTTTSNYSVVVKNSFGCIASSDITIEVMDVRCGPNLKNVSVCHKTGSKSNPTQDICISANAVASHLEHGDYLGTCQFKRIELISEGESSQNLSFKVFPNPNNGTFNIALANAPADNLIFKIYNLTGQLIYSDKLEKTERTINLTNQLEKGVYMVAIQNGSLISYSTILINR